MKVAYWPRFSMTSRHQLLAVLPTEQLADPGEPAQAGEPEQRGELEDAEGRDRAQQVEPSALADEVRPLRPRHR